MRIDYAMSVWMNNETRAEIITNNLVYIFKRNETSFGYINANNNVSARPNPLPACTSTPDVVYAATLSDQEKPRAFLL